MEDMIIKKQPPPPLAMHKDPQRISKIKPKIRIIHIFAPEIIKTDVANFRELVQRLTGKPSDHHRQKGSHFKNKKPRTVSNQEQENLLQKPSITSKNKKMELVTSGCMNNYNNKVIKEEEEQQQQEQDPMWNGANSGGFLAGFADLDGFIQELNEEFPMLPMEVIDNHHVQYGFGERRLV